MMIQSTDFLFIEKEADVPDIAKSITEETWRGI